MNWPAGAVKSAKVESTVPVPVRFQPGGKRPVSKPPLVNLATGGCGCGWDTGGTVGTMLGRLRLLLFSGVATSGRRAAARATSLFCSLTLMACHVAWLNPNFAEAAKPEMNTLLSGWLNVRTWPKVGPRRLTDLKAVRSAVLAGLFAGVTSTDPVTEVTWVAAPRLPPPACAP